MVQFYLQSPCVFIFDLQKKINKLSVTVKSEQEDKDGVTQATIQTQTSLKKYFFKKLQRQKRQDCPERARPLGGLSVMSVSLRNDGKRSDLRIFLRTGEKECLLDGNSVGNLSFTASFQKRTF